ncbi:MAG: DUF2461 domain-containing protein [Vicinamibacterales bacterium]
MVSPFTRKTVAFLRALKRNNDRDWFKARKGDYEAHVRAPMVALLGRLADDFRAFAPELVADPKVSLYRIYRDTRFSEDKTPLKTHAAAHFPHRALRKGGAGLYLEIAPQWVWIGGGIYMPETQTLASIRTHVDAHHRTLRKIVESKAFIAAAGKLHGEQLTRVPRGYPKDHPAAHYLRFRQFLAGREYPADFASDARFYPQVLAVFRHVAPMVRFLNTPLLARPVDPLL